MNDFFDPTSRGKSEMYADKWKNQTCPHCRRNCSIDPSWTYITQNWQGDQGFFTLSFTCPSPDCKKQVIFIVKGKMRKNAADYEEPFVLTEVSSQDRVVPPGSARPPAHEKVPKSLADDYNEACLVLPYSAKASAALSRRCLQHLVGLQGTTKKRLADQIDEILEQPGMPEHIRGAIDHIRHYGNYGAHPIKSDETGDIVEVEPGEAEWTLDVLESLFDFYYVQPEELRAKQAKLEQQLKDSNSGKLKG